MKVSFYDNLDALEKEIEYRYDAFDRRIAKLLDSNGNGTVDSEEHFVYDGDEIVLQYDDAGSLTNRYLHGPAVDQVLADEDDLGDVLWPLADNQGTVRDLVDDNGDVQNHLTFDAFGNITSESDDTVDHLFAYTGREWDEDAELYYYRARWYDPAVGRFLSEDPIGFGGEDANLLRYVRNSPANFGDPAGLLYSWNPYQWIYDWVDPGDLPPKSTPPAVYNFDTLVSKRGGKTRASSISDYSFTGTQGDAYCRVGRPIVQMGKGAVNELAIQGGAAIVGATIFRFARGVTYTVDDLIDAGRQIDRNNLTRAGRALQKHGDRAGSVFPKSIGTAAARNAQGQNVLEGILKSPNKVVSPNRLGGVDVFDKTTGRGARFDCNGILRGFREP